MYYIPDLLRKRSGGQLARCWLAATLSEAQFKTICNRRHLLSIDIEKLCHDIQDGNVIHKFSLYLLSQLMHGILKLQLYKTRIVEDSCKLLQVRMMPVPTIKKKRNKKEKYPIDLPDLTTDLVAPPSFSEQFRQDLERQDLHLLPEPDMHFGVITEAEHDDFGQREFDRINEEDLVGLVRGDSLFGEKNDRNINANDEIALREGSSQMPLGDLNLNESVLKTPSKRARRSYPDTPSKRQRMTQFDTLENQENIPPPGDPMNISPTHTSATVIQPFIESSLRTTLDVDLGEDERTVDEIKNSVAEELDADVSLAHLPMITSDLTLEPISVAEVLRRQKVKRTKFLDLEICISSDGMKTQIANPHAMTRPIAKVLIDIDRIHLDSQSLFNIPSTSVRFKSKFMWANVLSTMFFGNIGGPFHVRNDGSAYPESVRARDATNEKTAELSDDIDHNLLILEPSNGSVADTVALVRGVPHAEIPHEPVDIGDTRIFHQQIPESAFATTLEDQTFITPAAVEVIGKTVRTPTSNDSFMPHVMNERRAHSRSSSGDKTVDINNVVSSSRSNADSHEFSPLWTKEKLFIELKKLWDKNSQQYPITFKEVFPPETTVKSDGACGILDLLQLATDSQIQLQQAEAYAQLYIYLDFD